MLSLVVCLEGIVTRDVLQDDRAVATEEEAAVEATMTETIPLRLMIRSRRDTVASRPLHNPRLRAQRDGDPGFGRALRQELRLDTQQETAVTHVRNNSKIAGWVETRTGILDLAGLAAAATMQVKAPRVQLGQAAHRIRLALNVIRALASDLPSGDKIGGI